MTPPGTRLHGTPRSRTQAIPASFRYSLSARGELHRTCCERPAPSRRVFRVSQCNNAQPGRTEAPKSQVAPSQARTSRCNTCRYRPDFWLYRASTGPHGKRYGKLGVTMLDADSPLNHLPQGLSPEQALVLDGIKLAAEVAALSYRRLEEVALAISESEDTALVPYLFADAHSLIDSISRLRIYLGRLPDPDSHPALADFEESTRAIRDLRDAIQHPEARVPGMAAAGRPLAGTLTWVYVPDPSGIDRRFCIVVPGVLHTGPSDGWKVVEIARSVTQGPVDNFGLSLWQPPRRAARAQGKESHVTPGRAGVTAVSLTQAFRRVEQVIETLEEIFRPQFAGHEDAATTLFVAMHLEFRD
jgi:hypothetical protein